MVRMWCGNGTDLSRMIQFGSVPFRGRLPLCHGVLLQPWRSGSFPERAFRARRMINIISASA